MADLPLPSAANCLTPLIESLVQDKPARLAHINYGVGNWSNVLAGWKAQATLNLRRVADEMMQARLPLASGKGLRELAASKFFANIVDVPTRAIGQFVLVRNDSAGTGGTIPAGTRFRRSADPRAQPVPIQAADFVSLADINAPFGTSAGATFQVPVQCVQTGTAGNVVVEYLNAAGQFDTAGTDIQLVDSLFGRFSIQSATCAGGGTSFSDDEVRRIAGAQPKGRRGPTDGAVYAGAYLATGVRHVAVFEDLVNANTVIYVADESWASDTAYWQPAVIQTLLDGWAGFGCSLNPNGAGLVDNIFLNVAATVQLRSADALRSTAAVQAAVEAKLRSYFNDRPDWYTFRRAAIRGVIARADPRILTCTSVTITDRVSGVAYSDPALITAPPARLPHWALFSFQPTFQVPA